MPSEARAKLAAKYAGVSLKAARTRTEGDVPGRVADNGSPPPDFVQAMRREQAEKFGVSASTMAVVASGLQHDILKQNSVLTEDDIQKMWQQKKHDWSSQQAVSTTSAGKKDAPGDSVEDDGWHLVTRRLANLIKTADGPRRAFLYFAHSIGATSTELDATARVTEVIGLLQKSNSSLDIKTDQDVKDHIRLTMLGTPTAEQGKRKIPESGFEDQPAKPKSPTYSPTSLQLCRAGGAAVEVEEAEEEEDEDQPVAEACPPMGRAVAGVEAGAEKKENKAEVEVEGEEEEEEKKREGEEEEKGVEKGESEGEVEGDEEGGDEE